MFILSVFESTEIFFLFQDISISFIDSSILLNVWFLIFIGFFVRLNTLFLNMLFFFYNFFHNIVESYLEKKNVIIFFPFLLYTFFFIVSTNVIGLLPGVFAGTTHFTFTLSICITIWFTIITLGFSIKSIKFLNIIIPSNVPSILVPFLILIEFISYFFRFISLSLRLFANILAGHILIHVVTGACYTMGSPYYSTAFYKHLLFSFLLFFGFVVLFSFELVVAFLQGYILIILILIYLTDLSLNKSH